MTAADDQARGPDRAGSAFAISLAIVTAIVLAGGAVGAVLLVSGGHDPTRMGGSPGAMGVAPGGVLDLSTVSEPLAQHYRFAAAHPHAYGQVPCFCGCEATLDHRSLLDCFVRPQGGWEAHAAGCAVCVQESEMLRGMLADGATPAQVRAAVIERFTMGN